MTPRVFFNVLVNGIVFSIVKFYFEQDSGTACFFGLIYPICDIAAMVESIES